MNCVPQGNNIVFTVFNSCTCNWYVLDDVVSGDPFMSPGDTILEVSNTNYMYSTGMTSRWVQCQKPSIHGVPFKSDENMKHTLSMLRKSSLARSMTPQPPGTRKLKISNELTLLCTKMSPSKANSLVSIHCINHFHTCSRRGSFSISS